MKPQSTNENSYSGSGLRSGYGLARLLAGTVLVAAATLPAAAQNASWLTSPGSGDFNTATNWTPATVPTGTAFFGFSNTTALSFSANTTISGWTFNAGASAYSFTNGQTLNFTGAGIAVNGGCASITNNFVLQFSNASTAGNAHITNSGGLTFFNTSTAGSAAITNNSGGVVDFSPSTGPNNDGKLSAGSIAGAGSYYLGARQLTFAGNNLSTTVSGAISDCGPTGTQCAAAGATGGALVKIGTGTLTLNGVDTYTGGTTDNAGTLAGTGTLGNTLINSGATFAPGSGAAGTFMTINGSLAFASGAVYLVQINPAAASLANATTATLTGGNV